VKKRQVSQYLLSTMESMIVALDFQFLMPQQHFIKKILHALQPAGSIDALDKTGSALLAISLPMRFPAWQSHD
jgi:hypothetical protein